MKNALILLTALFLIIATGYRIAHASSPTQANSEIQVTAVNKGINENGDTAFKIYFTFDLDKKPLLPTQHRVQVEWPEGWKIERYHLMEDGVYNGTDIAVLPFNNSGSMEILVDSKLHFDEKGLGQGYVILTSEDKKVICERINSRVSIGFFYESAVKNFKLADSTSWNNEAAVGFH